MQPANENPYMAARAEWNERYGDFVKAAHMWRLAAFSSAGIAACAVIGCIFLASRTKFVPYVTVVDGKGQVIQSLLPAAAQVSDRVIQTDLAEFITHYRSVITDAQVQHEYLERAYAHVSSDSAPKALMDTYFAGGGNPFERVGRETVTVDIESVLVQSKSSYLVEWRENTSTIQGQPFKTQRFRALITTELRDIDQSVLTKNPLGLFITGLSIQKIGG